jgi:hypothetical protein
VFCVNCGKSYEDAYKFCNHCGAPVPRVVRPPKAVIPEPVPVEPVHVEEPVLVVAPPPVMVPESVVEHAPPPLVVEEAPAPLWAEQVPEPPPPPPERAPYAACVVLTLSVILLLSVVVFGISETVVRGRWDSWLFDIPAVIGAGVLIGRMFKTWRRVFALERDTDTIPKHRHRRVLRNSIIIALLFFAAAAGAGAAIGKSRDEAQQLVADSASMQSVGDRVSKARRSVESTILSYAAMYTKITPDVEELEATMRRVQADLVIFDKKFPAQHKDTEESLVGMDKGLKRMALLKRQIALMRDIERLGTEDEQLAMWERSMMPLIDEENALLK